MKNVLKFLSLFLVVSLGFMACGEDDPDNPCDAVTCDAGEVCVDGTCVPENTANCTACGTYSGNVDSDGDSIIFFIAPGTGVHDVMEPTPFTAEVTEHTSADSLNMLITLTLTYQGSPVSVPIGLVVGYNSTTKAFAAVENQEKTISVNLGGAVIPVTAKIIDFSGTIDGTTVDGTVELDDPDSATDNNIEGKLFYTGTAQ